MIYHSLTGRESRVPLGANTVLPPSRSDDPHLGAVVAQFKHRRTDMPGYVAIPEVQVRNADHAGGRWRPRGFLGATFDPLAINDDPARTDRRIQAARGIVWRALRAAAIAVGHARRPIPAGSGLARLWRVSRIGRAADWLGGGRRHVRPVGRAGADCATATAGIALARACCWPGGWSSMACRLSACTSTT